MAKNKITVAILMSVFLFECSFHISAVTKTTSSQNTIGSVKKQNVQKRPVLTDHEIKLLKYVAYRTELGLISAELNKEEELLQNTEAFLSVIPNLLTYLYCNVYINKFLGNYLHDGMLLTATTILSSQIISSKLNRFTGFLYRISLRKLLRPIFKKIYKYIYE